MTNNLTLESLYLREELSGYSAHGLCAKVAKYSVRPILNYPDNYLIIIHCELDVPFVSIFDKLRDYVIASNSKERNICMFMSDYFFEKNEKINEQLIIGENVFTLVNAYKIVMGMQTHLPTVSWKSTITDCVGHLR